MTHNPELTPNDQQNADNEGRFLLIDSLTGDQMELNSITPTYGKIGIDFSGPAALNGDDVKGGLRTTFNVEAHDPAYKSTSSCKSEITYIDGEKGVLLHRGYNIKELTDKRSYMDVAHLLLDGELPTEAEKQTFEQKMVSEMVVPKHIESIIDAFDTDDAPMDILAAATSALSAKSDDSNPSEIVAQVPTLVAMIIRKQQGKQNYIPVDPDLGFTENFVRMAFADDDGSYTANPVLIEAMDKLLILHADHEQNASTSEVRGARSAGSKMAASIAAGVVTLAGPLHGGANQRVLEQLQEIANDDDDLSLQKKIKKVLARAKDKNDDFRLMGFGHRVYKNRDPRAAVLKEFVDNLLDDIGVEDPRLDIARQLETEALADDYFQDRKLYPNVDFYSGIAMAAMGLEPKLFTLIFAAGRVSGWTAQALELDASAQPITRPRQQYMGQAERPVPSI